MRVFSFRYVVILSWNVPLLRERTIRDRLYKYFTYTNTHRYIDALPKSFKTHSDTAQSTTGMAPSQFTDSDVLTWKKKNVHVRSIMAKFSVGQHIRISKEMKFTKDAEQNIGQEIFQINKRIKRTHRPHCEL